MNLGLLLIAWSIRISMLLLVATMFGWLLVRDQGRARLTLNTLWSLGFVCFLVHVLASFHFVHHWSHHAAYVATAKETRELMGVEFGGGVYFNYVFIAAWAVHLWFSWSPAVRHRRLANTLSQLCLLYMLFIAFNGIVVFKSGWLRAVGIGVTVAMVIAGGIQAIAHHNRSHRD